MKKSLKVAFIIFFMSVISFIGISNTKALSPNYDLSDKNYSGKVLPNLNTLPNLSNMQDFVLVYDQTLDSYIVVTFNIRNNYTFSVDALYTGNCTKNDIPENSQLCSSWNRAVGISNNAYTPSGVVYSCSASNCSSWYQETSFSSQPFSYQFRDTAVFVYSTSNLPVYYSTYSGSYLRRSGSVQKTLDAGYLVEVNDNLDFHTAVEQGEVILAGSGGVINNLVSYYLEYDNSISNVNDYYKFYYTITTGGGARESVRFYMKYKEGGFIYNNEIYHYYYNLPMSYNAQITYTIYDNQDNLVKTEIVNAYLSSLTSLADYDLYDFTNYNIANMSYVNSDMFGVSSQLNGNIKINVVNYTTGVKSNFLTSSYYVNSHTDNAGITWYEFDFNNEPLYLEIINEMSNQVDLPRLLNSYDLFLYFPSDSYVHLSTYPVNLDTQGFETNQQAYKDNNGNINYVNNNVIFTPNNSGEFFELLKKHFTDIDNFNTGLTGIITSPLYLIQNLLTPTCTDLSVPLPYINSTLTLPCMDTIYSQYFGSFYTLYQNITFGVIAYWVIIRILRMVKDFRSPDHDEIEVLDL